MIVPGAFASVNSVAVRTHPSEQGTFTRDAIGACVGFDSRDRRGLIAHLRIAATARGDETLQLCSEGMLSASVGFGVDPRTGQTLDTARRVRRITHAVLDHISLVQAPAYAEAEVIGVRSATPTLNAFTHDPIFAWAEQRCDRVFGWARRRTRGW